jgi:hypothetical protein
MRIVLSLADSGTMYNKDTEKHHVNFVDEEANDEEGNGICIAEWIEKPGDKPIVCSFLKPNRG